MAAGEAANDDAELLARFVAAFQRGIDGEVAAMRTSADAFEIALGRGEHLGGQRYGFERAEASERLAPGGEATLRTARGEQRVVIERCDELRLIMTADPPIDLAARPIALLVAPWFLYERLQQALAELDVDRHAVTRALALFGKRPHRRVASALRCDHAGLNASQRAAVQLCCDSELAFVWGPPGTGKTATLTQVLEELLARDRRILLASTTNAAIDQVLAQLAARPWFAGAVAAGTLVRLGRSEAETYGAELADAVARAEGDHRIAVDRLRARLAQIEPQLRHAETLLAELAAAVAPQQTMFAEPPARLRAATLAPIFGLDLADVVARMPPAAQAIVIETRQARLAAIGKLARARVAHHLAAIRDVEGRVIGGARVVMCTLTNAYLSPLMTAQRFDVLVAEEAGMAALPALFYAACLCREQAIMVGDPRQLPPIVQSRDAQVQRAIGRSIFEVTTPDAGRSDLVALLDVQYRMHPAIGGLVGRLFYDGRLRHGADPARSEAIAARAPYPGLPLVVVDTGARTTCQRSAKGNSRINPDSAELTADLALAAITDGAASVAVITPYAAQAREVRRGLTARRIGDAVECSTIHRFQGRECDVVIIDLVDAAPMRPGVLLAGSLHSDAGNLMNVSLSRARGKLVVVAAVAYFEAHAPSGVVAAILREARQGGAIVAAPVDAPGRVT